jgi:hypothetical protein
MEWEEEEGGGGRRGERRVSSLCVCVCVILFCGGGGGEGGDDTNVLISVFHAHTLSHVCTDALFVLFYVYPHRLSLSRTNTHQSIPTPWEEAGGEVRKLATKCTRSRLGCCARAPVLFVCLFVCLLNVGIVVWWGGGLREWRRERNFFGMLVLLFGGGVRVSE